MRSKCRLYYQPISPDKTHILVWSFFCRAFCFWLRCPGVKYLVIEPDLVHCLPNSNLHHLFGLWRKRRFEYWNLPRNPSNYRDILLKKNLMDSERVQVLNWEVPGVFNRGLLSGMKRFSGSTSTCWQEVFTWKRSSEERTARCRLCFL